MSDTPRIIPTKVSSSCQEMWGELRSIKEILIPYLEASQIYGEAGDTMNCSNLFITMNDQAMLDTLDGLSWSAPDSGRVGLLYTDPQVLPHGMIPIAFAPSVALERFFFSPREIGGIVFNPLDDDSDHFSYQVKRFYLPRLIGMLKSSNPWEGTPEHHADWAKKLYEQDKVFEALHHSALARELGAPVNSYFFPEILAIISCSLWENVQQYLRWYESKEASSPELELLRARLLSISGKPLESLKCSEPIADSPDLASSAWLEIGRARLINRENAAAVTAFDKALSLTPNSWDSLLGRGIALRSMHYEAGDRTELLEAKSCFDKVSALGGLHQAEALHHGGTICGRLMMLEEAIDYYRRAIHARYSSVSRMNLALVLKQLGREEEAAQEFKLLDSLDPKTADSIRPHFAAKAMTETMPPPQSPMAMIEEFNKNSREAFEQIKQWKIPLKGDLMDFRRCDEFFSLFAPQGQFSEQCIFHGLSESEIGPVLLTIARHLAGVLVRRGYTKWCTTEEEDNYGASVQFKDNPILTEPFNLFFQTIRRFEAGANQDNLTSLEFMIAHVNDYTDCSRGYQSPWKKERASATLLAQWEGEARWIKQVLSTCGFELQGEMGDLQVIDDAVDFLFSEPGVLNTSESVQRAVGEDAHRVTFALGMHLGFLIQKFTDGVWYNHTTGAGICIDECLLTPVYPVRKIEERIQALGGELTFAGIATLLSPLACAHLARMVQRHEIETREELKKLLCEAVPSLLEDDPTGSAVDRMTSLIEAQAGELGLLQ